MKDKITAVNCMTAIGTDGALVLVTVHRNERPHSKTYIGKQNTTRAAKLVIRAYRMQKALVVNGWHTANERALNGSGK